MTAPKRGQLPKGVLPEHVGLIAFERHRGATWPEISEVVGVPPKTLSCWWAIYTNPPAKRPPREEPPKAERYMPPDARPQGDRSRAKPRTCLRCKIIFDSEGPHNRMCSRCRTAD